MRSLRAHIWKFLQGEDGPTAVEYAVMLAMIILVCLVAISILGKTTNSTFHVPDLEKALSGGS